MIYSKSKKINEAVRQLLKMGWSIVSKSRHLKIESPDGRRLTVPGSPSDHRSELNWFRQNKTALEGYL